MCKNDYIYIYIYIYSRRVQAKLVPILLSFLGEKTYTIQDE